MDVNLWAVLAATAVQFLVGAVWYMVVFPKQWGEMFGFDKLSKKKQQEMQAQMGPYYAVQILVTFLTSFVLVYCVTSADMVFWQVAFWLWLGFVVPTQVSAVIFGGVDAKWIPRRIGIMASGAFVTLLAGAWVIELLV